MKRLIFGCGYLGERVAERWASAGDEVTVITRSAQRAAAFKSSGYVTLVADVTNPDSLATLPTVDTVLFAVGYDRSADPSIHQVYAEGMKNVLAVLPPETGRLLYISTTGVYGSATGVCGSATGSEGGTEGGWVDEQTETAPHRDGGRASLAAEEALRQSPFADRGVALRLAGIYGPGRVPFLDKLTAGESIPAPQQGNLNLIHVLDAAEIVIAASKYEQRLPPVMCVSDGNPPMRGDYYREIARLIGASEPQFVDPPADSPTAARAAANKKVRNDLMLQTLGISLRYPNYRTGLAAILGL